MAATKLTAIAITVAGGLFLATSFSQTASEFAPYFVGGSGEQQRYSAIVSGDFTPAISRWSRDLFIDDCLKAPGSVAVVRLPEEQRAALYRACRERARTVVHAAPTASNAWLVIADTSARLGDLDASSEALAQSKRSAPNIEWLATRRTRLLETYFDEMSVAYGENYQSDLDALARSESSIQVLVRRYVRQPEFRSYYEEAISKTAPALQKTFLGSVSRLARIL